MNRDEDKWLGFLAFVFWSLIGLEFFTGILLAFSYNLHQPYESVSALRKSLFGAFLGNFHYWTSALLIVTGLLNIFYLLWNGAFTWERRWIWWGALGGFVLCLASQMSGNLLPFSQHDVRTAYVEASIASSTPKIGDNLFYFILGGERVTTETLSRWYFLHRFLLPILFVLLAIPVLRTIWKIASPRTRMSALTLSLLLTILIAIIFDTPLGPPATEGDTTGSTGPMWYVLPMHSLLNVFSQFRSDLGWVGALLIPLILSIIAFALPFLFRNPSGGNGSFGRFGFVVGGIFLFLFGISYGNVVVPPFEEPSFEDKHDASKFVNIPINKALAERGSEIFRNSACLSCHRVGSLGKSRVGPDLNGVGRKHPDPRWLMDFLKDPKSKGVTRMPSFGHLPEEDRIALVEYLRSLK
ncbi:MAG TPA: cytochrome b N-terminal domain-containing protein [Fimbriimonadales bacterium]|nr:cytochrome b N-terminal domain-containing protein [Fimbriimonadales bacterium]